MKFLKLSFIIFFCILGARVAFGFETHDIEISRNFSELEESANNPITVTVNFNNLEGNRIRGFYYSENIPEGLQVDTVSIKIAGIEISNYTLESGLVGDVYPGYITYRWILETPPLFNENNTIPADENLEIVYSITAAEAGTFDFEEFSWVGYYDEAAEGERAAFGNSEETDRQTITFSKGDVSDDDGGGGGGCFISTTINSL